MRFVRVAVIQFDYLPAALLHRKSPLEDPLSGEGQAAGLPPEVPPALFGPLAQLRARIRNEHGRQQLLKLRAVLERCGQWGVELVVLPEYSVAAELLPELAGIAPAMVVVAGTHAVELGSVKENIYGNLKWGDSPKPGSAVAPVLYDGRIIALQPKLAQSRTETRSLVVGTSWEPIDGGTLPFDAFGVMTCFDFLYRERNTHQKLVAPKLDDVRFLAVPGYTVWHGGEEANLEEVHPRAREEASKYGRPVLFANVASVGGSSIFVDADGQPDLRNYPTHVGLLEKGDEGVIVADVNLGFERVGGSMRFAPAEVLRPVALASFVYRHHPVSHAYAAWTEAFEQKIREAALGAVPTIKKQLLRKMADLGGGQARKRRLEKFLAELDKITQETELQQFTREVVLPESALPLGLLRRAWASAARELVFEWMTKHRDPGLVPFEARLRDKAAGIDHEQEGPAWTSVGIAALRKTIKAVRGSTHGGMHSSISGSFDMVRDEYRLWFRATPMELEQVDWDQPQQPWPERKVNKSRHRNVRSWSSQQLAIVHQLWLFARAQGHAQVGVLGVEGAGGSATLVRVFDSEGWRLVGAGWGPDVAWLSEHGAAIAGAIEKPSEGLEILDKTHWNLELEKLLKVFRSARQRIEVMLEHRLSRLSAAETRVRAMRDNKSAPVDAREALGEWAKSSDQVALITGAFGIGKSTLLARWCLDCWEPPEARFRPILAEFRNVSDDDPLGALLDAAGLDPKDSSARAALMLLLDRGQLVACFDGFDELMCRQPGSKPDSAMRRLLHVAGREGKVVISSRDNFFPNVTNAGQLAKDAMRGTRVAGFMHLHIQALDEGQVYDVVEQYFPDPSERNIALAKISRTDELGDLVRTPMLLALVLQTINEIELDGRIVPARIYESYLTTIFETERDRSGRFGAKTKRAFVGRFAVELWKRGESVMSWHRLRTFVMTEFEQDVAPGSEESVMVEFQGAALLVREGQDCIGFASSSFLEFLVAAELLESLVGRKSPEEILRIRPLTPLIGRFVAELVSSKGERGEHRGIVKLKRWLTSAPRSGPSEARRDASANAVRLLRDIGRYYGDPEPVPAGADLRGVVLDGEELRGLQLRRANLEGASLVGVDFTDANLTGASLRRAVLTGARLWRVILDTADFEHACLDGVEAHQCSLVNTSIRSTSMTRSTWTACDWGEVKCFEGVTLGPTILGDLGEVPQTASPGHPVLAAIGGQIEALEWSPDDRQIAYAATQDALQICRIDDGKLVASFGERLGWPMALAWSEDGTHLAFGCDDGDVRVWRVSDGKLMTTFSVSGELATIAWAGERVMVTGQQDEVSICCVHAVTGSLIQQREVAIGRTQCAAWSWDGELVAWTEDGSRVRVRRVQATSLEAEFDCGDALVVLLVWDRESRQLASFGSAGTIRVWDPDQPLATIEGPATVLRSAVWSYDGRFLATASVEGALRVWSIEDKCCHLSLNASIDALAWSRNGPRVACGGRGQLMTIWQITSGAGTAVGGDERGLLFGAWCGPESAVLTFSARGCAHVWNAGSGELVGREVLPVDGYGAVALAPQARRLALAQSSGEVQVWSFGRSPLATFKVGGEPIERLAWSHDEQSIAVAVRKGELWTVAVETGRLSQLASGILGRALAVAWSHDGRWIACGHLGHDLRVYEVASSESCRTIKQTRDHGVISWSHDNRFIASAGARSCICIHELQQNHQTQIDCDSTVTSLAWSHSNSMVASASVDGVIRVWRVSGGELLASFPGHGDEATAVDWSPDDRRLLSTSLDGSVRIWRVPEAVEGIGHAGHVLAVAWAPNGEQVATASDDGSIRLWPTHGTTLVSRAVDCGEPLRGVAYSPDGAQVAALSAIGRIHVCCAREAERLGVIEGAGSELTCVAWAPDGRLLATGSADRGFMLWDAQTWSQIHANDYAGNITCMAWSLDGRSLATGSANGEFRIWSVPDNQLICTIDRSGACVTSVDWSPDGERVIAAFRDSGVCVWKRDGCLLADLDHQTTGVAWSPDGSKWASWSADGRLCIRDADGHDLLHEHSTGAPLSSGAWSPDSTQFVAGSLNNSIYIWRVNPLLGIFEAHDEASLVRGANGHFFYEPDTAPVALAVRRPDRAATFYLPLAGVTEQQSRRYVVASLAGYSTPSLMQTLGWSERRSWDGEVQVISVEHFK